MNYSTCVLILCIFCVSCKKEPQIQPPVSQVNASFTLQKACSILDDSTQYIDSSIVFVNGSDTGRSVTYKWDFGDNTFSTEKNPTHKFAKPGIYTITLYTLLNNRNSDTAYRKVRIIIGQRELKTTFTFNEAVGLDESSDKGTLALISHYNTGNSRSYSLYSVDSLLKQKWIKLIPGTPGTIRLSSIKKISANEYILSGNYNPGNTNQFALSKINANGDLIWQKYISNLTGINNYTLVASDGSLITIGNSDEDRFTLVVKCDAAGNEIWRRSYINVVRPPLFRAANKIIEVPGGFVFASVAEDNTNRLFLTKIDFNGNTTMQSFTTARGLFRKITGVGVAYTNNAFMVYTNETSNVYMFDSSLSFIEVRDISNDLVNDGIAGNNKFYLAQGRFESSYIKQLNSNGSQVWSSTIPNGITLSCSSNFTRAKLFGKKLIYTSYNEIVAFADQQNETGSVTSSSVYLLKYLPNGDLR
jgi:PKD repeat protein